jgi:hypothetical protein
MKNEMISSDNSSASIATKKNPAFGAGLSSNNVFVISQEHSREGEAWISG